MKKKIVLMTSGLIAIGLLAGCGNQQNQSNHDQTPILSEDGKTVTYGLYPQTNVDDPDLVSALDKLTNAESNGWYLYNNEYYAKVSATPYDSNYKFDNGTTIVSDTTYWFKCEPIV